jgi:hypothetical protein
MAKRREFDIPSAALLREARSKFVKGEARDLFYRLATWLLGEARDDRIPFSPVEALAVLLQTWNRRFYVQRRRNFDAEDLARLQDFLQMHRQALEGLRKRSIESVTSEDEELTKELFSELAEFLGVTGASKAFAFACPAVLSSVGFRDRPKGLSRSMGTNR